MTKRRGFETINRQKGRRGWFSFILLDLCCGRKSRQSHPSSLSLSLPSHIAYIYMWGRMSICVIMNERVYAVPDLLGLPPRCIAYREPAHQFSLSLIRRGGDTRGSRGVTEWASESPLVYRPNVLCTLDVPVYLLVVLTVATKLDGVLLRSSSAFPYILHEPLGNPLQTTLLLVWPRAYGIGGGRLVSSCLHCVPPPFQITDLSAGNWRPVDDDDDVGTERKHRRSESRTRRWSFLLSFVFVLRGSWLHSLDSPVPFQLFLFRYPEVEIKSSTAGYNCRQIVNSRSQVTAQEEVFFLVGHAHTHTHKKKRALLISCGANAFLLLFRVHPSSFVLHVFLVRLPQRLIPDGIRIVDSSLLHLESRHSFSQLR